jgi:hypothetical protein
LKYIAVVRGASFLVAAIIEQLRAQLTAKQQTAAPEKRLRAQEGSRNH